MTTRFEILDRLPVLHRLGGKIYYPARIIELGSVSGAASAPEVPQYSCLWLAFPDRGEVIADSAAFALLHYSEIRAALYPSLAEQADMQYHDIAAGNLNLPTLQAALDAVKVEVPKP